MACQRCAMSSSTASTSRPSGWLQAPRPGCRAQRPRLAVVAQIYRSDTHYDVLGVSFAATPDQVKAAYRKLSKQLHPDVRAPGTAPSAFLQLQAAYETLSDPDKRTAYDRRYIGFSCFSNTMVEKPPQATYDVVSEGRTVTLPKYMEGFSQFKGGKLFVDGMFVGEP